MGIEVVVLPAPHHKNRVEILPLVEILGGIKGESDDGTIRFQEEVSLSLEFDA